jgi:fatty acid desaturase
MRDSSRPPVPSEVEGQDAELLKLRTLLRDELAAYKQLRPWVSYLAIFRQWVIIFAAIGAAVWSGHYLVWIAAFVTIATRQHALGVLGHEGSHYRLSESRPVNDAVADILCWLPLLFCYRRWQHEHAAHHRYVNAERDPYLKDFKRFDIWSWPKTPLRALATLLGILTGAKAKAIILPGLRWSILGSVPALEPVDRVRAGLFYTVLVAALAITDGWLVFVVLWLLPLATLSFALVHWRTVAEHLGMGSSGDINSTRHVNANFFERLTFAPLGINYHIAHHLFPSVPYYNLSRLHRRLLREPVYLDNAVIKAGYFGSEGVYGAVVLHGVTP